MKRAGHPRLPRADLSPDEHRNVGRGQRAFGEVEDALSAEVALTEREVILAALVRDRERALELTQVQYRVGAVDVRSVEQAQLALYSARQARVRVQAERLAQRINLHLALGGSFDAAPALDAPVGGLASASADRAPAAD